MATDPTFIPGFEDFRRYQNGEMSAEEEHKFEKRMLEDPFVAEAVEGFLTMTADFGNSVQVSQDLSQALHDRLSSRRKMPVWIYAAAASVLVSMGAYWLVFLSDQNKLDTTPVSSEMVTESPKIAPNQEAGPAILPKPAPNLPEPKVQEPATAPQGIATFPEQEELKTEPQKLEQAILADENEEQLAAAEPRPDVQPLAAQAALSKHAAAKVRPGSQSEGFVVAKPVSGGYAAVDSMPVPLIGWTAYQRYLFQSTVSNVESDDITVHFTVAPNGALSEFHATGNSVNLFEAAIRIVKQGPIWLPAKANGSGQIAKQQVVLRFHLAN